MFISFLEIGEAGPASPCECAGRWTPETCPMRGREGWEKMEERKDRSGRAAFSSARREQAGQPA
jgi:hypothetical protein